MFPLFESSPIFLQYMDRACYTFLKFFVPALLDSPLLYSRYYIDHVPCALGREGYIIIVRFHEEAVGRALRNDFTMGRRATIDDSGQR